jgi:transposase
MADLLNLPHLQVSDYKDCGDHYHISATGTMGPEVCPDCGHTEFYGHGTQKQSFMDTPIHGKRVLIEITRRRYRCKACGRTTFERLPDIDNKRQATCRLITYIENRCLTETFMALAREVGVDNKTVRNIFDDLVARKESEHRFKTPEVLGIDELKIIGDYRAMLTNIGHMALFDMLPTRKKESLREYFGNLPNKQNVTTLVMDMWKPYRQLGREIFPGRLIVVDKFHLVRMGNEGLERVRKKIRRTLNQSTRIKMKNDRFVLLKRESRLTDEEREKAEKWFVLFPKLRLAYEAKERLFGIYEQPSRAAAEAEADRWIDALAPEIAHEFRAARTALSNWHHEIFNYFENPVTNAYAESLNNIARLIVRMGRGYSFEVLRARLLFDRQVIKSSASLRKKDRKPQVAYDLFTSRNLAQVSWSQEDIVAYGADLPTLVRLLEEGYFS